MTVSADWQAQYGTLLIDATTYALASVPRGLIGGTDVRSTDYPRVLANGNVSGPDYLGAKTVLLQIEVGQPTALFGSAAFTAAMEALLNAFAIGQAADAPLTFKIPGVAGGNVARINCKPRRANAPVDLTYYYGLPIVDIELYAADPLLYSEALTTTTLSLFVAATGRTYPLVFPRVYGAGGSSGTVTVTNLGNATAPFRVQFPGPVVNPTIRNETLGRSLTLTLTIDVGDTIEIDTQARTVLLNGTASRYPSLTTSEWFGLAPGANQLRYSASSGSSTASVLWRSAWT